MVLESPRSPRVDALELPEAERRKLLSGVRFKVSLTGFVILLILAMGAMTVTFVSVIFNELNPTIAKDLQRKAERGASELAKSAEYGILLEDRKLINEAFRSHGEDADVVAAAATDPEGQLLAQTRQSPVPLSEVFRQPSGPAIPHGEFLAAWAKSAVEGREVGRVAVVVTTERLAKGRLLERRILMTLGLALVGGLILSLGFFAFYVGPLIHVTERAFERLRGAALELAAKQRLEKELEIAARIQTAVLPTELGAPGLEIAAKMLPAEEVGGDYYDLIPTSDGAWLGIGDVAGHGLTAGLVMMMTQSVLATLCHETPNAAPSRILTRANRILYDNVRTRLKQNEHVTLTLLRYSQGGRFRFAGAHEEMLVWRAKSGACENIPTPGTWLSAMRDIRDATTDQELELDDGDILLLYTDGVTEAMDAQRQQFGLERLVPELERGATGSMEELVERILAAVKGWMKVQSDDITVVAVRYVKPPPGSVR